MVCIMEQQCHGTEFKSLGGGGRQDPDLFTNFSWLNKELVNLFILLNWSAKERAKAYIFEDEQKITN